MKKFLFAFAVSLALGVWAAGMQITASEVQPATRAEPVAADFTSAASLNLTGVYEFRMLVCTVDPNDTLQAVGSLRSYLLDERLTKVSRNKQLDLDMTTQVGPTATSGQCINFPDQYVGVPADRLIYAASGLLLRDGGTLGTTADGGLDAGFKIIYRGWYNGAR